ncbi:MAG: hypothetical protein R6X02_29000 [Enhygromyxa sp.]
MSEQRWRPRLVDLVALLGFGLLWLVPMAWVGFLGGAPRSWPITAQDLYSVSCLFGRASERVSVFYVQVRRDGQRGWEDLDESEYFRLEPFGHRNRFDRFMSRFGHQKDAELARRELAQWIAQADREHHGERPPIVALRFLWADRVIDPERPPSGRWRKPPRSEAGPLRQRGSVQLIEVEQEPSP